MVATTLPSKPKLADEPASSVDSSEDLESLGTNGGGCCKRSLCWPLVKLLIFLVLLAFFSLIFTGEVFHLYSASNDYYSEVKIFYERPTRVVFPAVTVCNNNPIQKSKFCRKYPEHCSGTSEDKSPAVNLKSYYRFLSNVSSTETIPLGQSWQEFTKTCLLVDAINENQVECKHVRNVYWSMAYQNCFTFLSGEDKLSGDYRKTAFWLVLDFQPEENVENRSVVGGQLFIHDADERIPAGFPISSYTLKPGKMYRYRLRQNKHYRLPPPYESGCKYYDDDTQVSSQEECYNKCLYDKFTIACGCMPDVIPFFDVGHSTNYCKTDNTTRNCVKKERNTIEETCNEFCPISCMENTYEVKVDELDLPEYNSDILEAKKNQANLWFKFDSNEQKVFSETPVDMNTNLFLDLACLYGAVIILLLLMIVHTIMEMCRICKTSSGKKRAAEN